MRWEDIQNCHSLQQAPKVQRPYARWQAVLGAVSRDCGEEERYLDGHQVAEMKRD
jgi:hypothetical protein